jgi:hypothetical protein
MAVTKTKETAEAHDRVSDATGDLFDEQMVDLADSFIASAIDLRSLNILARY